MITTKPDLVIKASKIDGKGVFATRDFKKGEVVIRWDTSHTLTPEDIEKLPTSEKLFATYFSGRHILMQSPERYVNHSCDANTHSVNFCDVATRDIKKGEEITANYSETMEGNVSMVCNCGSKNCRGVIRASV
jgi:SET domain-containing protein